MKIEHLTLGGNAVIRDTDSILQSTRQKIDVIRLSYESKTVVIPSLPFSLRITATEEGAAFDINKGDALAVTNLCCFEERYTEVVLANIRSLADMYKKAGLNLKVLEPVTPQWLYSAVINPFALTPADMMIAGEVELYIYEQLYFAYKNEH
jgi:hypothetical protein